MKQIVNIVNIWHAGYLIMQPQKSWQHRPQMLRTHCLISLPALFMRTHSQVIHLLKTSLPIITPMAIFHSLNHEAWKPSVYRTYGEYWRDTSFYSWCFLPRIHYFHSFNTFFSPLPTRLLSLKKNCLFLAQSLNLYVIFLLTWKYHRMYHTCSHSSLNSSQI